MIGFVFSGLSLFVSIGYLFIKIFFWDTFALGIAPIIIGMFFLGAIQLLFIGILGEYIGNIHTQIMRRPPVVESERINLISSKNEL